MKRVRFLALSIVVFAALSLNSCDMFNSLLKLPVEASKIPSGTTSTTITTSDFTANEWTLDAVTVGIDQEFDKWYKITVGPKAAGTEIGSIWGSNPYTSDSSLAGAAVHAGAITTDGGTFYVKIIDGKDSYYGTTSNDITTIEYGTWGSSFVVYK